MILQHLWQSTLFAFGAGLMTLAFRSNRAEVRYWLWFAASFKFLVPFAVLASLGGLLPSPFSADTLGSPAVISFATPQNFATPVPTFRTVDTPAAPGDGSTFPILASLFVIWFCGLLALLRVRLKSWLLVRRAVRSSTLLETRLTETRTPIEIRICSGLLEPGVVGFLRPILLLPDGILQRLTPSQLDSVLAHEFCHVRRRDNLLSALHMIVESIFWFHPLVWWIGAKLMEERERACDEDVLLRGSEPGVYAEAILNVCKLYSESPLTCMAGVTGSNLRKRINAIMATEVALRLHIVQKTVLTVAGCAAILWPVAVGLLNAPHLSAAQSGGTPDGSRPRFEVASIKPCKDEPGVRMGGASSVTPGRLNTGCMPLVDDRSLGLIQRAYVRFANGRANALEVIPIKGGPSWIRSKLFEINAKAEENASPATMQGSMLQTLLEDRFKLKLHRETTLVPVHALVAAKSGPNLKPFIEGSCVAMPTAMPPPPLSEGQRYCKVRIGLLPPAIDAEGVTLDEFCKLLNLLFDRPVVNRVPREGKFNIHVDFTPDASTPGMDRPLPPPDAQAPNNPTPPGGPSIFTALQEQLGLKLERARGPGQFLVIDHAERPSAN